MHESGGITGKLSDRGYRLTPQRLMILSAIESSPDHISAEEIYAQVAEKYPHVNISTVYRTLELLKRLDMVYEINLGEGRIRYHSEKSGHHHHLVCQGCGLEIDVGESTLTPLRNALLKEHHFSAELRHLAIFGLCEHCRRKSSG
ncbi:MAG: transcriptional repressor [Chloroflexi bacterium RBG_16_50_9]|nr:MAG: transcriptional repressor [Chloroflexi bacterium RBG_16_50_9]